MEELKFVNRDYQEQLDLLASSLTERFRTEVEVVNPLSIPRDECLNRWDSEGCYMNNEGTAL